MEEAVSSLGLSRKTLNIMHSKATARVINNQKLSIPFQYCKGVRQGFNLSPLPFCLYIGDLESNLISNHYLQMI